MNSFVLHGVPAGAVKRALAQFTCRPFPFTTTQTESVFHLPSWVQPLAEACAVPVGAKTAASAITSAPVQIFTMSPSVLADEFVVAVGDLAAVAAGRSPLLA